MSKCWFKPQINLARPIYVREFKVFNFPRLGSFPYEISMLVVSWRRTPTWSKHLPTCLYDFCQSWI